MEAMYGMARREELYVGQAKNGFSIVVTVETNIDAPDLALVCSLPQDLRCC